MKIELLNITIFLYAILKVSLLTGFAPGMALTYWYERQKRSKSAKPIPFPGSSSEHRAEKKVA